MCGYCWTVQQPSFLPPFRITTVVALQYGYEPTIESAVANRHVYVIAIQQTGLAKLT